MSPLPIKPTYPCEPIKSIDKLALALGVTESILLEVASCSDNQYRKVPIVKNGKTRVTFEALGNLKHIQRQIQQKILVKVNFPGYLQGSLRGRDYLTNAKLHAKKKFIICEDVKNFFPSVKSELIRDLWVKFFHFSDEVALLLTQLTTKHGALPQGTSTSPYLANLVLWRDEPIVHARLGAMGIVYSRYVDDMAMSSSSYLSKDRQTKIIAMVYGMLRRNGLFASREKHEVFSNSGAMTVTKLLVNEKPSLGRKKILKIRSQVHHAKELVKSVGADHPESKSALVKAAQSVGQMGRFHLSAAEKLRKKIKTARK